MNGWIRIYRKIKHSDVAESDELLGFFVRLLTSVNWREGTFKGQKIRPGQIILSDRGMQERIYGSATKPPARNTILSRIRQLQSLGVVSVDVPPRNIGRIVTILNWSEYQQGASEFDALSDAPSDAPSDADIRRERSKKKGENARPRNPEQVSEYAKTLDPAKYPAAAAQVDRFIDHYEANGWRQGKGSGRPIKDWRAAFRGWVQRQSDFAPGDQQQAAQGVDHGSGTPLMTKDQLNARRRTRKRRNAS